MRRSSGKAHPYHQTKAARMALRCVDILRAVGGGEDEGLAAGLETIERTTEVETRYWAAPQQAPRSGSDACQLAYCANGPSAVFAKLKMPREFDQ